MKCNHNFKEMKREYYMGFCGYRVLKKTMFCTKCNKKKKHYQQNIFTETSFVMLKGGVSIYDAMMRWEIEINDQGIGHIGQGYLVCPIFFTIFVMTAAGREILLVVFMGVSVLQVP